MRAVAVLLFYQVLGELTVALTGVPIPGAVIGMVLLFLTLVVRNRMPADLQETDQALLKFLPVLFVPVGVGVMAHFSLLATEGWFCQPGLAHFDNLIWPP
jgi:holin-like protein